MYSALSRSTETLSEPKCPGERLGAAKKRSKATGKGKGKGKPKLKVTAKAEVKRRANAKNVAKENRIGKGQAYVSDDSDNDGSDDDSSDDDDSDRGSDDKNDSDESDGEEDTKDSSSEGGVTESDCMPARKRGRKTLTRRVSGGGSGDSSPSQHLQA